tara:strand:+ start:284 stop:490 length:207 start_codon:yes stop_codon:yes gene_type:complete
VILVAIGKGLIARPHKLLAYLYLDRLMQILVQYRGKEEETSCKIVVDIVNFFLLIYLNSLSIINLFFK